MCWVMLSLIFAAVVAGMFGIRYTNRIVGGTDDYFDYLGGPSGSYYGSDYSDYGNSVYDNSVSDVGGAAKNASKGSKPSVEFEKFKRKI